jgi:hypothetical protein
MNHILPIDYFLFTKYPELLRIRAVRDNMSRFNQAMAYLATIPESERMFVKLMRPRTETAVLNRNNFIMCSLLLLYVLLVFSQQPSVLQVRLCILCSYNKYL